MLYVHAITSMRDVMKYLYVGFFFEFMVYGIFQKIYLSLDIVHKFDRLSFGAYNNEKNRKKTNKLY